MFREIKIFLMQHIDCGEYSHLVTMAGGSVDPDRLRGVNAKQPLRGNTSDVKRNRMFYERHRLDRF